MVNCRDVSAKKMHGFTGLFSNFMTLIILAIIILSLLLTFKSFAFPITGNGVIYATFSSYASLIWNILTVFQATDVE